SFNIENVQFKLTPVLLFLCISSQAQNIIGKISDERTGEPLPGATVIVSGSSKGTNADMDGNFILSDILEFPFTIEISYASYKTKELELYEVPETPLQIKLQSFNILDEIVVVGYGTQERKNVVGSISKIEIQEVKNFPVASFDAQLQGRAP